MTENEFMTNQREETTHTDRPTRRRSASEEAPAVEENAIYEAACETAEAWAEEAAEESEEMAEEAAEEPVEEVDPNACLKCGYVLSEDQFFCPKCGTPKGKNPALICTRCGKDLLPGQEFCAYCGQKAPAPAKENALVAALGKATKAYKGLSKLWRLLIPAIAAVLVIGAIVLGIVLGNAGKDFRKIFPQWQGQKWATFAKDGTWVLLDSNPNDVDSDDITDYTTYFAANDAIELANEKLGFPSSINNKMDNTTWSMGRQSESNDRYTATWTYHPDKGIEVLYEVK